MHCLNASPIFYIGGKSNLNKKIKLGKLNFYIVEDKYVEYLSKFDKHIAYNKNQKRPYIGVVISVGEYYYFAPLFSPKPKHKLYKDNLTFFKVLNKKNKENLGIIRFSDMIPVPEKCIHLLDLKNKSYCYKRLLSEQYSYINIPINKQKIIEKAERHYNIVVSENKSKVAKFYIELSCNFKILEEKADLYRI